jgi:hypothetical protein
VSVEHTIGQPFDGSTFEFIELGRYKSSFKVALKDEFDFWKAVKPHLMSKDLEWSYDTDTQVGHVYAGMRTVGEFRKLQG